MKNERKLKRSIIKEELVEITGDYIKAAILNQFIYWSERVSDFDQFIEQENARAEAIGEQTRELTYGWIYKSAEEMSDETMLGLSATSMRTHIKALIERGFLSERNNPKVKWDRTKQYRVNILEIMQALDEIGCVLEGYRRVPCEPKLRDATPTDLDASSKIEVHSGKNFEAIPETTTETTTEIIEKERKKAPPTDSYDSIINEATEDEDLRELYREYIKMRKLNKSPMTNRALKMLIAKVKELEPNSIDRQKQLLETAIMHSWKSVYPLKDQTNGYAPPQGNQYGTRREVINGKEYEVRNGKYYIPNGCNVAVDPFAEDDLAFLK